MSLLLIASFKSAFLGWTMGTLSLFLILLILVQRGKGGGLTGALGGPGGQSAFGSKAGDTFTLITVVFASVWAIVCALAMWSLGSQSVEIAEVPTAIESKDEATGTGVIPTMGGDATEGDSAGSGLSGFSGLSGLSGLSSDSDETTETPSMDLTPATPAGDAATEPSDAAPAETEPAETETEQPAAEDGVTEEPATEEVATEESATEQPTTEEPAAEAPAEEPAADAAE